MIPVDYDAMLALRKAGASYDAIGRRFRRTRDAVRVQLGLTQSAGSIWDLPDLRQGETPEQRAFRRYPINRHKPGPG